MSIVRQLLQVCAVQAIRGKTHAGNEVHDSKITALAKPFKDQRRPLVILSIEEAEQPGGRGNDGGLLGRPGSVSMLIQSAVFELQKISSQDGGADEELEWVLGETDAAFEATINIIDRQWRAALTDPTNEWADIFRGLVTNVGEVKDIRATDPDTGRRHSLRFTSVKLDVVPEPQFGRPLPKQIERGLAAIEALADYADLAAQWRTLLAQGSTLEDWQKRQADMFVSRPTMDALGLAPLVTELTDFERAVIDVTGVGTVHVEASDG